MSDSSLDYQYVLELFRSSEQRDETPMWTAAVKVDWQPLLECARFHAVRHVPEGPPRNRGSGSNTPWIWDVQGMFGSM